VKKPCGDSRCGEIDISVIVVNWNTKDLLKNCLCSVYQTVNNLNLEIIVVDNASSDGSVEMLKLDFPQVIRLVNQQNRGFGAANNQGFAVMKGEYALLLNTDTVLTTNAVAKLWEFMEAHPEAAIVGGQLLNADESRQNSIASFPTLLTLVTNESLLEYLMPRRFPSKRYEHKGPIEVDSVIGACMMIRKKALDEIGVFDERYFFFFEETDLAYAIRRSGWKIFHIPDAYIYHLQGQSIGHNVQSRIEFYRSRYQFLRKWHSRLYYFCAGIIIILRLAINWAANCVMAGVTVGLAEKLRQKCIIYSHLIFWHFKRDKQQS